MDEREAALRRAAEIGAEFLRAVGERHVGALQDASAIAERLGGPLPDAGMSPTAVLEELAEVADPGIVASVGPRYFGFVVGGTVPAALATDVLAAAWGQNAGLHALSPAAAAAETVAGRWMLDLLGLPGDASFGLPTGAGLGNAIGIAAARHAVLQREGWDVEARGLYGAPDVRVVIGEEAHATVLTALQYLGLGRERVTTVPTDEQGRMRAEPAAEAISGWSGPVILVAQAGNVNTGAFDPFPALADAVAAHPNAWLHVDGAFGLWAATSPRLRHMVEGVARAQSWSTDAHKWLNAGYDCGFVATREPGAHRAAMAGSGAYLVRSDAQRENWEWVLDSSRRARGFALYAAIRSLGRDGVRALVERCCDLAARMAAHLSAEEGVEVLNEVVLNQVLVRFGDDDDLTRAVIARVQADGTAWMGGTTWHGKVAMRISVSNWATTEADADASVQAILRAHAER
ncbi:MAG TPA: pyridoxal-dependent decarboxylase [Candidatus Limnocylindria bacterium]|nr:pyridoxal-dependent decarboxylase [Candidatus Limnocylindria bacterium]